MTDTNASKLKILYLLEILKEDSDEENGLSMAQLIEKLDNKHGIKAERKSVSRDLSALRESGYGISGAESKKGYYYLEKRDFELSELRFLIDAVLSSKCITLNTTKKLIEKLEKQTSKNGVYKLKINRSIDNRMKCKNEEFYDNINEISKAISENKKIGFQYYSYNVNKVKELRGNGREYILNPYDLVWNDDFYYLIGNHDKYDNFTHYRIDRMCNIGIKGEDRRSITKLKGYDCNANIATYLRKTFRMYGGESCDVEIKFTMDMINIVVDRFGEAVTVIPLDSEYFKVYTNVNIGEDFISWILQYGKKAEVLSPDTLRKEIKLEIDSMKKLYE